MTELQVLGSEEAETLFRAHQQNCQPMVPELEFHENSRDEDGVQHFLFRAGSKFQYLAFEGERLIHADPQICSMGLLQEESLEMTSTAGDDDIDDGETSLDLGDQMVVDCEALFGHVTLKQCNRKMTFKIKSAAASVWDGIAVDATVEVNGKYTHRIMCDYEVSPWSPDAQLLQIQHIRGVDDKILKESLNAVMVVEDGTALCDLDKKDGLSALELEEFSLSQQYSLGELSLSRGYEHLALQGTDPMPPLSASMLAMETPASIDHRTAYSHCFLQNGAENMRNQGRCGSCWAFAAASATMADLCISKAGSDAFHSSSDRYEVSVAQIMACNSGKRGCNGGNAGSAGSAWSGRGITKERDSLYMCGGGDPSKHFDVPSTACKGPPWGRTCVNSDKPMAIWNFAGVKSVRGEKSMREWIGRGHSMYFRFDTHRNIFGYRGSVATTSVYKSHGGTSRAGGHAVTLMGYGSMVDPKDASVIDDYWLIQNSWGTGWGFGGYGRYLRGSNFGNCERTAYGFLSWVTGGTCPASGSTMQKCTGDGSTWGSRGGGNNSTPSSTGGAATTRGRATTTRARATTTRSAPTGLYSLKTSGNCLGGLIPSMGECSVAAADLRLSDTTAQDDRQGGVTYDPSGCYFEGGSLKFNSRGTNRGKCSTWDKCLCKNGGNFSTTRSKPEPEPEPSQGRYELKSSGSCSTLIKVMGECSVAAIALKLSDTTAQDDRQRGVTYDPPYCYFEGGSLKFNSNGQNRGKCTVYDKCLCRKGQAPTVSPPKPSPVFTTGKPLPVFTTGKPSPIPVSPTTPNWGVSTTKPQGNYVQGKMGSSLCPMGARHIVSEADCQAASEQLQIDEFGFRRSEDGQDWPNGCYSLQGKGVYYNSNTKLAGLANPNCLPICVAR